MAEQAGIDLIEYENGILRIDGSIDRSLTVVPQGLEVRLNGNAVPFHFTKRYADVVMREGELKNRCAFVVEVSVKELKNRNCLEIVQIGKEKEGILKLQTTGYQSRVCSDLKDSYWCFDKYMIRMPGAAGKKQSLEILRAGKGLRIKQEILFLKEILLASYGSKKMFSVRMMYWLTRPWYRKKNIWITFDKLYKGGDCGEYFYKYLETRKKDGIVPVYVIRKNAPDYQRLTVEGYHPAVYQSLSQRLLYLNAKMVFATHSGVHSFCGFNNWEIQFVQDRLQAVNTCIQHGLSVQDLRADSNRTINNNQRYYCASLNEIKNLSQEHYDYDPRVLKLTGIPRYDGLIDQQEKQILITPTWRSYIAMPSVMGSARPYNPDFINTQYYQIFQNLLENRKLTTAAQQTGYRLIYLLHPVISAQKKDFRPGEGIEILSAVDSNYEQLLTQSALMVTDYSGVQFDFAYMRKPVVYFHPPQLPPHYGEGGFDYEKEGFGEICRTTEELVDQLCSYMKDDCRLKDEYRRRQDEFFAYADQNSCSRIYADAIDFLQKKK